MLWLRAPHKYGISSLKTFINDEKERNFNEVVKVFWDERKACKIDWILYNKETSGALFSAFSSMAPPPLFDISYRT